MTIPAPILAFCQQLYTQKDSMHGIAHIERLLEKSNQYIKLTDTTVLAIWLHGLIETHESKIRELLSSYNLPLETIIQIAKDSLKNKYPVTFEGSLIHDMHLLEGNDDFLFIKSILTGYARGQTLAETRDYYLHFLYKKNKCTFPENQALFEKREQRAWELFHAISFLIEHPCKELEETLIFTVNAYIETDNEKSVLLHSIRVCQRLFEKGYPVPILQAALMCDITRETKIKINQIQQKFGDFQANLIHSLTILNMEINKNSNNLYLDEVAKNKEAIIIQCAKLIDNIPYIQKNKNNSVWQNYLYFYKKFNPLLYQEPIWIDFKKNMNPFGCHPSPWIQQYEDLLKIKKTALDIGCAHGSRSYQLAQMGLSVTAIDKALPNVLPCQSIKFIETDVRDFIFESYDVILAINVLQFIDKKTQQAILNKIIKSLTPEGLLFIESFTNDDCSFKKLSDGGHFNHNELREWCSKNKLCIIEYNEDIISDNHAPMGPHIHGIVKLVARKDTNEI